MTVDDIGILPADLVEDSTNRRKSTLITVGVILVALAAVLAYGSLVGDAASLTDLERRNQGPSLRHPFGTDWLGRDMLARTGRGLRLSLIVGASAASASAIIALLVTAFASFGRAADTVAVWLIDLFLALPHLVLLILLTFVMGGGLTGMILAISLTHWPSLARVLRGESQVVMQSDYVALARRFGQSRLSIARRHLAGHLLPQFVVGLILLFPHAILHEAALSFLGLGVDPSTPSIGITLADSMRHLSAGLWWLAVFPGIALVVVVKSVDSLGNRLRHLLDPRSHHG